jgi:hypothetical protein
MDKFQDWENPMYSNIETLKILEKASDARVTIKSLVSP